MRPDDPDEQSLTLPQALLWVAYGRHVSRKTAHRFTSRYGFRVVRDRMEEAWTVIQRCVIAQADAAGRAGWLTGYAEVQDAPRAAHPEAIPIALLRQGTVVEPPFSDLAIDWRANDAGDFPALVHFRDVRVDRDLVLKACARYEEKCRERIIAKRFRMVGQQPAGRPMAWRYAQLGDDDSVKAILDLERLLRQITPKRLRLIYRVEQSPKPVAQAVRATVQDDSSENSAPPRHGPSITSTTIAPELAGAPVCGESGPVDWADFIAAYTVHIEEQPDRQPPKRSVDEAWAAETFGSECREHLRAARRMYADERTKKGGRPRRKPGTEEK